MDARHPPPGLEAQRGEEHHPQLDHWRANVGTPVSLDVEARAPARLAGVDVLCWNVAIGLGRLEAVLARLRSPAHGAVGATAERPLVVLLQEAYREDHSVPRAHASAHHGGELRTRERSGIDDVAVRLGLSLRYAPSMRNGAHASDRGNAILSNVRLAHAHAVLLPYVRQRRVAVAAQLEGHPALTFVSGHLDVRGRVQRPGSSRRIGAGRTAQATALARHLDTIPGSVVLGADLNTFMGVADPAVRALVLHGLHPAHRVGTWRHTFHTPVRLLLDHVLFRGEDIAGVEVSRIDELPRDASRTVFGSDHHPLLARVALRGEG